LKLLLRRCESIVCIKRRKSGKRKKRNGDGRGGRREGWVNREIRRNIEKRRNIDIEGDMTGTMGQRKSVARDIAVKKYMAAKQLRKDVEDTEANLDHKRDSSSGRTKLRAATPTGTCWKIRV
jgi:hypothetical protein